MKRTPTVVTRVFCLFIAAMWSVGSAFAGIVPNPTITASATAYSGSYVAANVFDGTANEYATLGLGAGAAFSTSAGTWIQFDFGSAVTVDRFIMIARANAADVIGSSRLIFSNDATFDSSDTIFTLSPAGSNGQGLVKSFAATTARYARWEVATSTGTSQNLGAIEIKFLNTASGKIIAAPTVIGSATPFNGSYAAANAVNGDAGRGGGLEYACASLGAGMYVDFDFGSVVPLSGFDFFDRIPAVDRTTAFNLIFSNDTTFGDAGDTTLSFTSGSTVWGYGQTFAAVNARYVRFDAAATTGAANNSGMQEIVFYKDANLNTPALVNNAATSIGGTSATVGGQVTRVGVSTPNVTLYYGTTDGGTTAGSWQNSVALGGQTGTFSTGLTGLQPFTRYFFTSFAQNTAGSAWAPATLDFSTPVVAPVVANLTGTLTISTAVAGVTVTSTGGKAPVVTLYYGTADGGTTAAAWQHQVSLGAVSTTASTVLGGLSPATQYFFRVSGVNEGGSAWAASTATFTTPVASAAVVENLAPTEINAFSANLNGRITNTGNAPTTVKIFYGPADGGTNAGAWAFSSDLGLQTGDFSSLVTNLSATTAFYFRAQAVNAAGTVWAASSATFTTPAFTAPTVYLNEFVAGTDNDDPHPYYDSDGTVQDWVELHNPSGGAADVGGYFLTDTATNLVKWRFPTPTIIPANGFLVVFASNKNRAVSGQQLHTNFKLDAQGEFLALVQPDGSTVVKQFAPTFPTVPNYWSYGLKLPASGGVYAPFQIPTPGASNTTTPGQPAGDVVFSIPSQTFSAASVSLALSTPSPTAQIRYTTNRTEPTAASALYSAPLTISTTTMVRARAFEPAPEFAPGLVHSETYVKMGAAAATFTSNLPVVVLDGFSSGTPNANTQMFWTMFTPNVATSNRTALTNAPVLATRGRMVVRGSSSAGWPKYSMNLEAWNESDADTDVAPLGMAAESDWVLQSNYDYDRGMIRNPFMYEFSNRIGRWAPRSRFVEVFANTNDGTLDYPGDYLGVYSLMEKPERGGDRIDVERLDFNDLTGNDVTGGYIVKVDRLDPGTSGWVTSRNFPLTEPFGSEVRLNYGYPEERPSPAPAIPAAQSAYIRNYVQAFEDAVVQTNRINPSTGLHYTDYIDRDSWVDHGLLNILAQNADCFRLSTYMHKKKGGKLVAGPIWDFDRTIGSTDTRSANPVGWSAIQPATDIMTWGWWKYLWTDADFWQRYTDRWAELRGGILTDANLTALVTQYETELSEAAVRNYSKWTATPPRDGPDAGTNATFSDEMDIGRSWITQRTAWIDSQFIPAPLRSPAGGQTSAVTITATQGTIYYTLDGTDPRLPGGAIRPSALTLSSGTSATVSGSTLLTARTKTATLWSAPSTGYYFGSTPAAAGNIIVTELHYHPGDPSLAEQAAGFTNADDFEFIELMNISLGVVDLSGSRFTAGVDFTFPLNTTLTAGQRVIIVSNRNAFAARHPGIAFSAIAGEYLNDRLNNIGEQVRLESSSGGVIFDFTYGTTGLWPAEADGTGRSLVLIRPSANPALGNALNWRASAATNGTPLTTENTSYAAWKTAAGITLETDDLDGDGLLPLLEYGTGSDPTLAAFDRLPTVQRDIAGDWVFQITRSLSADDADFSIQTSGTLGAWDEAAFTIDSRVTTGNVERFQCRVTNPPAATRFFLRTRWFLRN